MEWLSGRIKRYVITLAMAASLVAVVAHATPSAYTAPETKVVDPNGVDLVSGQYFRSDTFLTIGDPASGGLAWSYTGHPGTDSYTGEIWYTGSAPNRYWTVKIAGSTESIAAACEASDPGCRNHNSPNTFADAGSNYTYTTGDGTVYTFKKLAADTSSSQRRGIMTGITRPNGDSITINHEHESCTSYSCGYRIKNVISNRGFAFKYEYQSANFYRLQTIRAVNRADVYCDDQINSCLAYHNAITFDYPNGGATFKVTDAMGNSTEYGVTDVNYWDTEVINYVKQPDGWTINATYDTYGRITSLTNPEGTWNYAYSDNTLAAIQNTVTPRTVTVRDSADVQVMSAQVRKDVMMPVSVTNPGAGTATYTINAFTNGTSQRKWGRVAEVIQPEGNKVAYTYDNRGNVTSMLHTPKSGSGLSGFTLNANYDTTCTNVKTCNQPNWTQDAKGNYTSYTYNSTHGGLETTTLPADGAGVTPKSVVTYQQFTAQIKNSNNGLVNAGTMWLPQTSSTCSTAVTCDGTVNQLKTITDYAIGYNLAPITTTVLSGNNSLSSTASQTYDWLGNVISVDGPLSGPVDVTYRTYDANRRSVFEVGVDPDGGGALVRSMAKHSYDAMGREILTETGTGASTVGSDFAQASYVATHYNARGLKDQITSYITGNGTPQSLSQFSYDIRGRQVCAVVRMNMGVTPPADPCVLGTEGAFGPDRITRTYYNAAGQVSELWRAVGTSLAQPYARYTYTNNGLKATEKDANGNLTTLEYDGVDRLKKLYYPSATVGSGTSSATDYEQYDYDTNGNRTYWRRRDGQILNDCFDNLNRVIVHYVHAQSGCTATGGAKDVYTSYDLTGKILAKRFASTSGSGVSYSYDGLGRVTTTTDMNGRSVGYVYNAASARISLIYPDLNTMGMAYDNANRLSTIGWNATVGHLMAGYDDLGRLTGYARSNGAFSAYAYDPLGRLISMDHNLAGTTYDMAWAFAYNPAGQINAITASTTTYDYKETVASTSSRTFDGLNRDAGLVAVSGYDASGNLINEGSGGRTMAYDIENRLLSVTGASVNMRLDYDPEGRLYRYSTDGGSTWTSFLYDGVKLIGEYDNGGSMTRRYMHLPGDDNPWVQFNGSGFTIASAQFLYANYQGSIAAIADSSGTLTELYKYDPYGVPTDINNNPAWSGSRFRYTGQIMLPEAKLYYYKARVYDPGYGRFLQTDPIGSADDLNLYAYVGGDPVNGTDPTGEIAAKCATEGDKIICTYEDDQSEDLTVTTSYTDDSGKTRSHTETYSAAEVAKVGSLQSFIKYQYKYKIGVDVRFANPDYLRGVSGLYDSFVSLFFGGFGGSTGDCCFVAGTLVSTSHGLKPIEEIKVGDLVLSKSDVTYESAFKPVLSVTPGHLRHIYLLTVEAVMPDGTKKRSTFGTTDDHPWMGEAGHWIATEALKVGERVKVAYGQSVTVLSVEDSKRSQFTYNLEIADFHTYFVGLDRVWVHNLCKNAKKILGNLIDRSNELTRDVAKSRGASADNIREMGPWAGKTLRETAEAAARGDSSAVKAIKITKQAARLGQKH